MSDTSGEKSRASGSGPSKPQNGPDDLVRVMRDEKIVELRREGLSLVAIGAIVDAPKSTVKDAIDRWMSANGPRRSRSKSCASSKAHNSTRTRRS